MAWLRRSLRSEPEPVDQDLWTICAACKAHVFKAEWAKALRVCPTCGHHARLTAQERVALLLDEGTFKPYADHVTTADPLRFVDAKGTYAQKAEAARRETGLNESVLTGDGKIGGIAVSVAVMDIRFVGGSLGSGTGERIVLTAEHAGRHKWPFIIVSASGGARMQEGIVSLMQMAKTCGAIARLNQMGVPFVSILTDPTTGGVSASYAMMGDINIAEPGALIGFAGRRVIAATIKQKLPDDFQTAEYLLAHGFVDCIVARRDMKALLTRYLGYAVYRRA